MKAKYLFLIAFFLPILAYSQEIDHNTLNFGIKFKYLPVHGIIPMAELNIPLYKNYFARIGGIYLSNRKYSLTHFEAGIGRIFILSNRFDVSIGLMYQFTKYRIYEQENSIFDNPHVLIESKLVAPIELNYHINKKFTFCAGVALTPNFNEYSKLPKFIGNVSIVSKFKF